MYYVNFFFAGFFLAHTVMAAADRDFSWFNFRIPAIVAGLNVLAITLYKI